MLYRLFLNMYSSQSQNEREKRMLKFFMKRQLAYVHYLVSTDLLSYGNAFTGCFICVKIYFSEKNVYISLFRFTGHKILYTHSAAVSEKLRRKKHETRKRKMNETSTRK